VKRASELLEVSKAAQHDLRTAVPGPPACWDAELAKNIADVQKRSKGSMARLGPTPNCTGGLACAQFMHRYGLEGPRKRRWRATTVPDRALNLIQRHFGPSAELDRRYVGDINYTWTWQGLNRLATVIDLASRAVVGGTIAGLLRTKLVADAMHMASRRRRPRAGPSFTVTAVARTPARTTPPWPGRTASALSSSAAGCA
jgi:hypothetical protein